MNVETAESNVTEPAHTLYDAAELLCGPTIPQYLNMNGRPPKKRRKAGPFPFLRLPIDIRLVVYDFVCKGRRSTDRNALALRLASRQVNHEAANVMFSRLTFVLELKKWKSILVRTVHSRRASAKKKVVEKKPKYLKDRLEALSEERIASIRRLQVVDGTHTFNTYAGETISTSLPKLAIVTFFATHGGYIPLAFESFMQHMSRTKNATKIELTRHARFAPPFSSSDLWMAAITTKLDVGWEVKSDMEAGSGGGAFMVERKV